MTAALRAENLFSPTIVQAESLRTSLRQFTKSAWPHIDPAPLVWSWHLDALCDHLAYVILGDIRFLEINISPRSTKSKTASVIFPVWSWLQDAALQFLTGSYALQLAIRDNLFSRRLIDSTWFQERWGHEFRFSFDDKLKKQYSNDKGGRRIVTATDSAVTGEGGDIIIVDDPHNVREIESDQVRLNTHDWWDYAIANRLNQPDKSAWILLGQRTGEDDLFGHVERTHDMKEVVRLVIPNEYDIKRKNLFVSRLPYSGKVIYRDPRTTEGELMCPERISAKATKRLKRVMREKYYLQYQQDPEAGGGAILSRAAWNAWEGEAPECELLLSVYDTAFEEGQENDYSARTDWGVFNHRQTYTDPKTGIVTRGKERRCIILLGSWRDRLAYHLLKREAREHYRKIKHDYTLIEHKATGMILSKDLIRGGVKGVRRIRLDHGGRLKMDKVERAKLASTVLDDGLVYYMDRAWASPVIDECARFPKGSHDDWVDTCLMAWMFLRRMNEVGLWEETKEEDQSVRLFKKSKKALYG